MGILQKVAAALARKEKVCAACSCMGGIRAKGGGRKKSAGLDRTKRSARELMAGMRAIGGGADRRRRRPMPDAAGAWRAS